MEKMKTIEKKETPLGQSYWYANGIYQEEYNYFHTNLVPASGYAPTIHGEIIRCVSRLYYDFCNNGNCNAVDTKKEECHQCGGCGYEEFYDIDDEDGDEGCRTEDCLWCEGSGEDEGENFVTEYYQEMLDFLNEFLNDKKCVSDIEHFMIHGAGYGKYKFDAKEMDVYNKVVDAVMYQILTTENKPNPYFKVD